MRSNLYKIRNRILHAQCWTGYSWWQVARHGGQLHDQCGGELVDVLDQNASEEQSAVLRLHRTQGSFVRAVARSWGRVLDDAKIKCCYMWDTIFDADSYSYSVTYMTNVYFLIPYWNQIHCATNATVSDCHSKYAPSSPPRKTKNKNIGAHWLYVFVCMLTGLNPFSTGCTRTFHPCSVVPGCVGRFLAWPRTTTDQLECQCRKPSWSPWQHCHQSHDHWRRRSCHHGCL